MPQSNDLSRSFTALNQDNTLIVVIEMSQSSWLVAGMVPGVERPASQEVGTRQGSTTEAPEPMASRSSPGWACD